MRVGDESYSYNSSPYPKIKDKISLESDDKEECKIRNYIEELKNRFPGSEIYVGNLPELTDIKEYAESHYGTFQMVLSPEALKKMMSDSEFKKSCEALIGEAVKELHDKMQELTLEGKTVLGSGLVVSEDGIVSQWTAGKGGKQEDKPESGFWNPTISGLCTDGSVSRFRTKDGRLITIKKRLFYRPSKDLTKIARAANLQTVKTTMGGIRAQIYQLKSGGGDKKVANQLAAQAEQVLLKAQVKIKHLKKEELLKSVQKNAEAKSEVKKVIYLKQMLEDKQIRRKIREYGQIRDYYPTPYERERAREREEDRLEHELGTGVESENLGLQTYMPADGTFLAADVKVSEGSTGVFIDISL